jgi:hypothetical protein
MRISEVMSTEVKIASPKQSIPTDASGLTLSAGENQLAASGSTQAMSCTWKAKCSRFGDPNCELIEASFDCAPRRSTRMTSRCKFYGQPVRPVQTVLTS